MTRWGWLLLGCLLPALAGAEEKLGRLFFTPAERANLDYLRQASKPPEKVVKGNEETKEAEDAASVAKPAAPPVVSVGGFVKRSDGKTTVWVNGQPVQEKSTVRDIEVGRLQGAADQVQIKLPRTGQTVNLKAGQSYDPGSGKVVDSLRDLPTKATSVDETPKSVAPKAEVLRNGKSKDAATETATASPSAATTVAPAATR